VCSILPFFLRERFMAEKRLMVHLF
jgi:hypothetical protein